MEMDTSISLIRASVDVHFHYYQLLGVNKKKKKSLFINNYRYLRQPKIIHQQRTNNIIGQTCLNMSSCITYKYNFSCV